MAYDEILADRVRDLVAELAGDRAHVREQQMFGGLGFMIAGNMAVAASSDGGLLLRVAPAQTEHLTEHPGARPFVMRGRPMQGWLGIDADAVTTDADLRRWVEIGVAYARILPPK
jgi:TfoX/Sxy family transcriptional regulator of competence genes